MTPRVIVVDPTPFVRLAVRSALAAEEICVQAELDSAQGALEAVVELVPHVVLLDAELDPRMRVVRQITETMPGVCVVVLSPDTSEALALAAVRAGACGFVPKETAPERLPAIVRGVMDGEAAIPRRVVRRLLDELHAPTPHPVGRLRPGLSVREREVLDLLSRGLEDRAVADRLDISDVTVRRHAASAARKLGARHREDALAGYRATAGGAVSLRRPAA